MKTNKKQQPKIITGGKLNYQSFISKYPWVIKRGQNCILSPDSDGFLCGLFMSHYLGWKIRGFYDNGKILILGQGLNPQDCVFLDTDIFRKEIRSVGHHMVCFRNDMLPENWNNFDQAIQLNNLRGYDYKDKFAQKYPFATIHFLMSVVGLKTKVTIKNKGISFLLYTDGTFKNLFGYPDNCLSWFNFLGIDDYRNPAYRIFFSKQNLVSSVMADLKDIFEKLSAINNGKRGADKLQLTKNKNKKMETIGLEEHGGFVRILPELQEKNKIFLNLLSSITGWDYKENDWQYEKLCLKKFTKDIIKPTQGRYFDLIKKNPISFAITAGDTLEYTLEGPDKLF